MIKVALVKDNGEVAYTVSPAVDDMYLDGGTYDGCVARHIDHTSNDADVIATWYWNEEWKVRSAKTNDWHDWQNNSWVFNSNLFWGFVREKRDLLMSQCDWTHTTDAPLSESTKTQWASYRQALRDIPATYPDATSIENITWPTKPGA